MNIWIFTYDFVPPRWGVGHHIKHLNNIYQNTDKKNPQIMIFSANQNDISNHIQLFSQNRFYQTLRHIYLSWRLYINFEKIIKKYNLDVVHIHGWQVGIFLFRQLSVPVVFTCHHTYQQQITFNPRQAWKKILTWFEKRSYELAQEVICVSDDTARVVKNNYKIDASKIEIIPNGINLDFDVSNINKIVWQLVYVWRVWDTRKWVDRMIRTLWEVKLLWGQFALHIIWKWDFTTVSKEYIEKYWLWNNIVRHWFLSEEDKNTIIASSQYMLVPSIYEWFGLVALESIALGTRVIAQDTDGLRYVIDQLPDMWNLVDFDDTQTAHYIQNKLEHYVVETTVNLDNFLWKNIFLTTIALYKTLVWKSY